MFSKKTRFCYNIGLIYAVNRIFSCDLLFYFDKEKTNRNKNNTNINLWDTVAIFKI